MFVCILSPVAKHNAVTGSSNITALSHIDVQVFGHTHFRWFTHIPFKTAQLNTKQFALLPPKHILLCLRSVVKTNETQVVEVSHNDFLEFENTAQGVGHIRDALNKYEVE